MDQEQKLPYEGGVVKHQCLLCYRGPKSWWVLDENGRFPEHGYDRINKWGKRRQGRCDGSGKTPSEVDAFDRSMMESFREKAESSKKS